MPRGVRDGAGRAGPEATSLACDAFRAGGFRVLCQETPWQLTASSGPAFVVQVLQERLDAAVAQDPTLAQVATRWLQLRRSQLAWGSLRIDLGHCDVLVLPGKR